MNLRWISIGLGMVAGLSTALAFLFYQENQELRRTLAEQRRMAAAIAERETEPAPEADAIEVTVTPAEAMPSQPAPDGQETQPEGPGDRFGGGRGERMAEAMTRMLTDPDSRAAMLARMKSQVDRSFGDLFVALGLDEVQVETMRTLLADRQMAQMEAGMLMRTAESDEAREEARLWRDAKMESISTGIESVLGPDAGEILRDYQRSAPIRGTVDEIARRASYVGAPMTAQASTQLVGVIQKVTDSMPLPSLTPADGGRDGRREFQPRAPVTRDYVDSYLTQLTAQNSEILSQARNFLSTSQLEALADKQIEAFEAAQQQLNFQLRNPDMPVPPMGVTGDGFRGGPQRPPGRGR